MEHLLKLRCSRICTIIGISLNAHAMLYDYYVHKNTNPNHLFQTFAGAVQFKKEAGLSSLRYHFLVAGGILVAIGCLLLVIKCACFRIPLPDEFDENDDDFPLSPQIGEKHQNGNSPNVLDIDIDINNDHNHQREKNGSSPIPMATLTPIKISDDNGQNGKNGKTSPAGT